MLRWISIGLLVLAGCGGDDDDSGHDADAGEGEGEGELDGGDPGGEGEGEGEPDAGAPEPAPAIPELALWEQRMLEGGQQFCVEADIDAAIGAWGVETEGNVWYYDGGRVYQQIARYTGDDQWNTCAEYVISAYRDWVLATTEGVSWPVGALSGWRIFTQGLLLHHQRTGDADSREAIVRIVQWSPFSEPGGGPDCALSRETAYVLKAYLDAEELGEPRHPSFDTAVTNALGHIDGWFVSRTCPYIQPFMVGLTMDALIHAWEKTGDERIPPAIEIAADELFATLWDDAGQGFVYDTDTPGAAPDLNLLIAPAYAWLWQRTGDPRHLEHGDAAFAGGVLGAEFWSGKQFSQNYRSSFDYVKWRSAAAGTIDPLTRY